MNTGIYYALTYYGISFSLFGLARVFLEQPAHVPGFDFLIMVLMVIVGIVWTLYSFTKVQTNSNRAFHKGALAINLIFLISTLLYFS